MLFLLAVIFLQSSISTCFSQKFDFKVYRWEEVQNANPDTIYGLTFFKEKRTELPPELIRFMNLRYLNLNKNKIQFLPEFFDTIKGLEVFEAEKNNFGYFPLALTRLPKIRKINLHQNNIITIPDSIKNCLLLEKLDLSDNAIATVPESIFGLTNLKMIDLTGVRFGPRYQQQLTNRRPDIKWILDPPCDCME
jgi:Leucine-rich repeat (LRR) protein